MAKELKTWALFGPPLGRTWEPTDAERDRSSPRSAAGRQRLDRPDRRGPLRPPKARPLAARRSRLDPNDGRRRRPIDRHSDRRRPSLPAAWHGTLLPRSDADIWLAAAFADYEKIVALEQAIRDKAKDRTLDRGRARPDRPGALRPALALPDRRRAARRRHRRWPRSGRTSTRDEWYQIASGKGVLLLAALRPSSATTSSSSSWTTSAGPTPARPPRPTSSARRLKPHAPASPSSRLLRRLARGDAASPTTRAAASGRSTRSRPSPNGALIVSGTLKEADAQREAAERLQRQIARRWSNVTVPIVADRDAATSTCPHVTSSWSWPSRLERRRGAVRRALADPVRPRLVRAPGRDLRPPRLGGDRGRPNPLNPATSSSSSPA